jgi:hypothetical protein
MPVMLETENPSTGLQSLVTEDEAYAARYKDVVRAVKTSRFKELKEDYPAEFNSWNNRKYWAKKNGVKWANELEGFHAFLVVLGPIPSRGSTLDRIDPRGSYVPRNLRWASKPLQSQNRTNARSFLVNGAKETIQSIAQAAGKTYDAIRMAIKRKGEAHVTALLGQAHRHRATCEDGWIFPAEYRDELEKEYATSRLVAENRINFFLRLTRSDFERFRAERWNSQDDPEVRKTLALLSRLHNRAFDELAVLKEQDRHIKLYGHVLAPPVVWNIEEDHPQAIAARENPRLLRE